MSRGEATTVVHEAVHHRGQRPAIRDQVMHRQAQLEPLALLRRGLEQPDPDERISLHVEAPVDLVADGFIHHRDGLGPLGTPVVPTYRDLTIPDDHLGGAGQGMDEEVRSQCRVLCGKRIGGSH